jgi:hypothetical protein
MEMYTGDESYWECNEEALIPSTVYYKQVSLGNQHGLLSVGHISFEPAYAIVQSPSDSDSWLEARKQLNLNRIQANRYLFTFSGSGVANFVSGTTMWSSLGITKDVGLATFKLNTNNPSTVTNTINLFNGLSYSNDIIHEIKFADQTTLIDEYNDVCRREKIEDSSGNKHNSIIDPRVCNSNGFSDCIATTIRYGDATHPIWNTGTSNMPSINILDAQICSKNVWNISDAELPRYIFSWDWISAGSSGNNCAVLSKRPRTITTGIVADNKFICWGRNYDKPIIEAKHWPTVNGITIDSHTTIEDAGCGATLEINWQPCQVDLSMESPIFYFKSSPFAAGQICPRSSIHIQAKDCTVHSSYNTITKVLVFEQNTGWTFYGNATIDDRIPTIARHKAGGDSDPFTDDIFGQLSKTVYWPNGSNQFQHDTKILGVSFGSAHPLYIHQAPNTFFIDSEVNFLPYRHIFGNLDKVYMDPSLIKNNPYGIIPFWKRNIEFPSWTPEYPVVSGNSWLQNIYTPSSCASGHIRCLGPTGCCEILGQCSPGIYEEQCESNGGTWTVGGCPTSCGCVCFNETIIPLVFQAGSGEQSVTLSSNTNLCLWKVSESSPPPNWITIDPTSGSNAVNIVTVTVTENDNDVRTGVIILECGSTTKIINVTQQGGGGVCCVGDVCMQISKTECDSQSGVWKQGAQCGFNPCAGSCCIDNVCYNNQSKCGTNFEMGLLCFNLDCTSGACCVGNNCVIKSQTDCQDANGIWKRGSCSPNPCLLGACCDDDGVCTSKSQTECQGAGDTWRQGSCSPNPCLPPGGGKTCCDYFVGPCCKTTGECDENITPQKCHDDGGLFLGFNRTCFDCPQ